VSQTPRELSVAAALLVMLAAGCGQPLADASSEPTSTPNAIASASAATAPSPSGSPDAVEGARADLDKLVRTIESRHPDLFRDMTEAEWLAAIDHLDDLIPELVPDEPERLYIEFLRLVALPGVVGGRHGHMSASLLTPPPYQVLGLVTYTFADGPFITRALPSQQALTGARITAVAGRPIDEVRALIDPLIPRDNRWTPEIWFIDYLRQPEVLVGLGIVDAVGPVEITVEMPNGEARSAEIGLVAPDEALVPEQPALAWLPPDFAKLHYLPPRPEVPWTSHMGEAMWWMTRDGGETLYVQQNLIEPPPASVLDEIRKAARAKAVERVVLDLRHNLGGDDDGATLRTFQDESIDQPGRLFVITSTNVFSATPPLVSELDWTTHAVLVGEPIGGAPRFFWAGPPSVTLKNLPIPMSVSIPTVLAGTDDERLTIDPDIPVPLTGTDFFSGRDAAMEAILASGQ
jgi:hypothetical protein